MDVSSYREQGSPRISNEECSCENGGEYAGQLARLVPAASQAIARSVRRGRQAASEEEAAEAFTIEEIAAQAARRKVWIALRAENGRRHAAAMRNWPSSRALSGYSAA